MLELFKPIQPDTLSPFIHFDSPHAHALMNVCLYSSACYVYFNYLREFPKSLPFQFIRIPPLSQDPFSIHSSIQSHSPFQLLPPSNNNSRDLFDINFLFHLDWTFYNFNTVLFSSHSRAAFMTPSHPHLGRRTE